MKKDLRTIGYEKLVDEFMVVAEFNSTGIAENLYLNEKRGLVLAVRLNVHAEHSKNWVILSEIFYLQISVIIL